ncbi:MAG TPA: L,D-transpeptidase [Xanthobacteraceae bacterium]|nr:L,D-transpeptidase [Xanthobacteraceae bacterium]
MIVKTEVLLDRAHFSPGEIDGQDGDNLHKAIRAFQQANNLPDTGNMDSETWSSLTEYSSQPILKTYQVSASDASGPFTKRIPDKLERLARLPGLSYASPAKELSEKFHMSESLLRRLNPGVDIGRAGANITVANVEPMRLRDGRTSVEAVPPAGRDVRKEDVATIVVDKPARELRAYDQSGKVLAVYPATIGSEEKPAPSGTFAVKRIVWNPDYHYDPKFAWKGVKTKRRLTVKAGPQNPVGLVWIDLTAPSYGIHGTAEPANIGKTESHGCIRLTNWDALDLAAAVHRGTVVDFADQDSPVAPLSSSASTRR